MNRALRYIVLLVALIFSHHSIAGDRVWSFSEGNPKAGGTATHHRAWVQTSEGWALLFLPPDQFHFQLLVGFPGRFGGGDVRLDAYFEADPARDRIEKTETLEFAADSFDARYLETSGQSVLYLPVRRSWVKNLSSADTVTVYASGLRLELPMVGSAKAIAELYGAIERDGIGREFPSNGETRQLGEEMEPSDMGAEGAEEAEAVESPKPRLDLVDGRFVSISRDEASGDILFSLELINPVESNGILESIKVTIDEREREDGETITIRLPELELGAGESKTYTISFKEEYNRILYNILWRGAVEGRFPKELKLGIYGMEGRYAPTLNEPENDEISPMASAEMRTDGLSGSPVRTPAEEAAFREWLDAD